MCTLTIRFRNSPEKEGFLARRADPVRALDKICRRCKISPTAIDSVSVKPNDPYALTVQAAQAISRTLSAFLL